MPDVTSLTAPPCVSCQSLDAACTSDARKRQAKKSVIRRIMERGSRFVMSDAWYHIRPVYVEMMVAVLRGRHPYMRRGKAVASRNETDFGNNHGCLAVASEPLPSRHAGNGGRALRAHRGLSLRPYRRRQHGADRQPHAAAGFLRHSR